ncbi:hypothetical protein E8E78_26360 [Pseudomonas sp. BN505]|nr:hypothetical protein [Pseudomonas sp. BN605]MDH4860076.1 hypothetical protein [Pseudomonas sp. BN505]NTY90662.1 hypothetical protein [Pseudomonas putida]NTZ00624.1 hypothetical protein [Pseudomonas putida]NTZ24006.1 hypothetical protein [Pseudomonas putida]
MVAELGFSVACAGPFAGLPAPPGSPQARAIWVTCGSGQAREGAGTGNPSAWVAEPLPMPCPDEDEA